MTGTTEQKSWCVVGGGMLGLTLAHRLAKRGIKVTVIEASDRLGGLADAWQLGDVTWDRHYHVTLLSDLYLRNLIDELGLADQMRWTTTQTDFYTDRRFFPMNNAIDFLRFPPLNLIDKFRLAGTIVYASRIQDGLQLEKQSLQKWLTRLSGKRTYEKIWLPLLRAKLGANHRHASAAFIWAIIRRLYAARRSGLKTEMFGYLQGGYARLLQAFEQQLLSDGVRCLTSTPVKKIKRRNNQMVVQTETGETEFDNVVVSVAAPLATRICEGLSDSETTALNNILYQGIVCPSVLLKKPLRGAYITYITDPAIPYTAVIEMSALVDQDQFDGKNLVYLPNYVTPDDPLFDASDEEIRDRFLKALFEMYPHIKQDDVLAFRVSRVRQVLAVSTMDYSAHLPPVTTSVPGLHILNSAHIVNGTLNVNETVKLVDDHIDGLIAASDTQMHKWAKEPEKAA